MHHLPAVTIYNKGSVGGVGVQFGQEWGSGEVKGWWWHPDCTRARKNANRFSERYTV